MQAVFRIEAETSSELAVSVRFVSKHLIPVFGVFGFKAHHRQKVSGTFAKGEFGMRDNARRIVKYDEKIGVAVSSALVFDLGSVELCRVVMNAK